MSLKVFITENTVKLGRENLTIFSAFICYIILICVNVYILSKVYNDNVSILLDSKTGSKTFETR